MDSTLYAAYNAAHYYTMHVMMRTVDLVIHAITAEVAKDLICVKRMVSRPGQ